MTKVRDYTLRPDIVQAVEDAGDTILCCWDDWEASASQDAQNEQDNEAWFRGMEAQIEAVLYGMLDQIQRLP